MATRFYFWENSVAPASPSVQSGWAGLPALFARRFMYSISNPGDALVDVGGITSTPGEYVPHRQFISQRMSAGITFDAGAVSIFTCQVQFLESNADDNVRAAYALRIMDESCVQEQLALTLSPTTATGEVSAVTMTNRTVLSGLQPNSQYISQNGDRLVLEIGHNDLTGVTPSASARWGAGGTGDLPTNSTDTSTVLRPWMECSATITFIDSLPPITSPPASLFAEMPQGLGAVRR